MKYILSLALVILMGMSYANAQDNETVPNSQTNFTDTDPFQPHYGKVMAISLHTKANKKVPHKPGDRWIFHKDGKFTMVDNGVESTGTWSYNSARKKVTISINSALNEWEVKSSTNLKLDLSRTGESISLVPKA